MVKTWEKVLCEEIDAKIAKLEKQLFLKREERDQLIVQMEEIYNQNAHTLVMLQSS